MAGYAYVTKGYQQYNHVPSQQGGYDHGPQNPIINKNVAETKTTRWARAPASGYTHLSGTPTKFELLWEYVYAPNMVSKQEEYAPNYRLNYENAAPNKRLLSPDPGFSTQQSKQAHSRPGSAGASYIGTKTGNISVPNKSWKSAAQPATHHPLTTSSNNVSNALGYVEESINRSSSLDLRRTRPHEPQSQYEKLYFRAKPANGHSSTNTRTT